uniref:Small integral membrane protein 2 n=1 Tax=Capra hircus TaxID=9925 RepID=A0A8C2QUJ5_CAPHI
KEFGERTDASPGCLTGRRKHAETRGPAISILFGFWTSVICDTYIVLSWNKRILVRAPLLLTTPRIQRNRRQSCTKEDQSQVPEADDIQTFSSLDASISIKSLFCRYFNMRIF